MASVITYGAVGNGTTDDTAAIQACINANKSVYFPERVNGYRITGTLTISAGHYLYGDGYNSWLKAEIPSGSSAVQCSLAPGVGSWGTRADVTVRDMRIWGGSNGGSANGPNGISFVHCIGTRVDGMVFEGLVNNVRIDQGRHHMIVECISYPNQYRTAGNLHLFSSDNTKYIFKATVDNYHVHTMINQGGVISGARGPCIFVRRAVGAQIIAFCADRLDNGLEVPSSSIVGIHFENDCQGCKVIGGLTHGAYVGILFTQGSGPNVAPSYCEVVSHDVDLFRGCGILIQGSTLALCANMTVVGGQITAPHADASACIVVSYTFDGVIADVSAYNYSGLNPSNNGVLLANSSGIKVHGNSLRRLDTCVGLLGGLAGCIVSDNTFAKSNNSIVGSTAGVLVADNTTYTY